MPTDRSGIGRILCLMAPLLQSQTPRLVRGQLMRRRSPDTGVENRASVGFRARRGRGRRR